MLPSSVERVPRSTAAQVNEEIRRKTVENVVRYATAGPEAIARRLVELDREWDTERTLEANFGAVVALSTVLGFVLSSWWFVVAGAAGGFLGLHALAGWCPPLPIYRRLGFRTPYEIETERYALKAVRGDFRGMPSLKEAALDPHLIEDVVRVTRVGGDRPDWKVLRDDGIPIREMKPE